jgi:hypothetical protein
MAFLRFANRESEMLLARKRVHFEESGVLVKLAASALVSQQELLKNLGYKTSIPCAIPITLAISVFRILEKVLSFKTGIFSVTSFTIQ